MRCSEIQTSVCTFLRDNSIPLLAMITGIAIATLFSHFGSDYVTKGMGIMIGCDVCAFSIIGFFYQRMSREDVEGNKHPHRNLVAILATLCVLSLDAFAGCLMGGEGFSNLTIGTNGVALLLLGACFYAYKELKHKETLLKILASALLAIATQVLIANTSLDPILTGIVGGGLSILMLAYANAKYSERMLHHVK